MAWLISGIIEIIFVLIFGSITLYDLIRDASSLAKMDWEATIAIIIFMIFIISMGIRSIHIGIQKIKEQLEARKNKIETYAIITSIYESITPGYINANCRVIDENNQMRICVLELPLNTCQIGDFLKVLYGEGYISEARTIKPKKVPIKELHEIRKILKQNSGEYEK